MANKHKPDCTIVDCDRMLHTLANYHFVPGDHVVTLGAYQGERLGRVPDIFTGRLWIVLSTDGRDVKVAELVNNGEHDPNNTIWFDFERIAMADGEQSTQHLSF